MNLKRHHYRVIQMDLDLGWPGWPIFWMLPRLVGRYHSYLLPKQDDGASEIYVKPTQVRDLLGHPQSGAGSRVFSPLE